MVTPPQLTCSSVRTIANAPPIFHFSLCPSDRLKAQGESSPRGGQHEEVFGDKKDSLALVKEGHDAE